MALPACLRKIPIYIYCAIALFCTYAGSYFCRSPLVLVKDEFMLGEDVSSQDFGYIMAAGYGTYLIVSFIVFCVG